MVHSTWGDWFVRDEVEAADPDGVAVWYLGCNGFVLRSAETTIYIDPYFGDGDPPNIVRMIPVPIDPTDATQCDAVLVTHEHVDHLHPPSYGPLVEDLGADLYAPGGAYEEPQVDWDDLRAPPDRRHAVDAGDDFEVGEFTVHVRESNDPDSVDPVSYVIEHDAGTFFHPGDSRPTEAFADVADEFDLDLGALAVGSTGNIYEPADGEAHYTEWYMGENDAVEAANLLELDRLMPVHYDVWRGMGTDPTVFHEHVASMAYPRVLEIVTIGDRVDLGRAGVVQPETVRR